MAENIEFPECGSLSITYDVTGVASASLSVIRDDSATLQYTYNRETWGAVPFDLVVARNDQRPILGSGGWYRWQVQMQGLGGSV